MLDTTLADQQVIPAFPTAMVDSVISPFSAQQEMPARLAAISDRASFSLPNPPTRLAWWKTSPAVDRQQAAYCTA